jgi:hypothetical protein
VKVKGRRGRNRARNEGRAEVECPGSCERAAIPKAGWTERVVKRGKRRAIKRIHGEDSTTGGANGHRRDKLKSCNNHTIPRHMI